jgi:DNA-binding Xre family transcriptional regulator
MKPKTKLHAILIQREMSQEELRRIIFERSGKTIGSDRISRIVNGQLTNYYTDTAKLIASALSVSIEDILEDSLTNV